MSNFLKWFLGAVFAIFLLSGCKTIAKMACEHYFPREAPTPEACEGINIVIDEDVLEDVLPDVP